MAVLKQVDCRSKAIDHVLKRSGRQTGRKSVRKHQTFALTEPLDLGASTRCLERQELRHKLESQN
jgi:hypothetical protein